jgi:hypothetical protein
LNGILTLKLVHVNPGIMLSDSHETEVH